MVRCSTGSMRVPSTIFVTISGRPAISSNPSRRIISIRIASCNSPRPSTLKVSGEPGFFHANRDVGQQFFFKPLAQVAAGHVLAFPPRETASCSR